MESNTIRLTIKGGRTFTATLVDNSSTQALKEQLAKGNITVEMEDYASMEKVGSAYRSRETTGPPRPARATLSSIRGITLSYIMIPIHGISPVWER